MKPRFDEGDTTTDDTAAAALILHNDEIRPDEIQAVLSSRELLILQHTATCNMAGNIDNLY